MTVKELMKRLVNCDPDDEVRRYSPGDDRDTGVWMVVERVEVIPKNNGCVDASWYKAPAYNAEPFVGLS